MYELMGPSSSPVETGDLVLEVVPSVMRVIRSEMRRHGASGMSVPEFRALLFVRRRPGSSLAELATHLGIGAPSASVLVERLVQAGWLERGRHPAERRRIVIDLSPAGRQRIDRAHDDTRVWLTEHFLAAAPVDLEAIRAGLRALERAIGGGPR